MAASLESIKYSLMILHYSLASVVATEDLWYWNSAMEKEIYEIFLEIVRLTCTKTSIDYTAMSLSVILLQQLNIVQGVSYFGVSF